MEKIIPDNFHNMSRMERIQFLKANADEVKKDQEVTKSLSPDEKDHAKEEYVLTNVELSTKQEQYDKVKDEWNEELKPLKKKVKNLMDRIRLGYETIQTDTYLFRDHEEGRVYTILPDGEVIDSRRMLEHEKQSTIHNMRSINSNE